jgi:hypothetical protein
MMKFIQFAMLAAVAALPQLAAARNEPGAQFGALQEVYGFCAKVLPAQAGYFEKRADGVLAGVNRREIPEILHSPAYQRARHVLAQSLQQLPNSEAVSACAAIGGGTTTVSRAPDKGPKKPDRR